MTDIIRIHETGGPDVLRLEQYEPGTPGPGQALVEHTAIGLNYIDTYHRSGLYPLDALPSGLGMEAAGVVREVGPQVTEVSVGQRVAYAAPPPGAYAGARLMAADRLVPLPDNVDDRTAAAVMLKGMTVEYLIRRTFPVQSGQTVLLHAAAGGVGMLACQWLSSLGVTVIGTVGSNEKADLARAHGCHHPVVYTGEDFVARVRELTDGEGVPVVFDSVGAATFEGSLACLKTRGTLVGFGNASGAPPPFDMGILARMGSLHLTRPTLFDYTASREDLLSSAGALFQVIQDGAVDVLVNQTFSLAEVAAAHRVLEARGTTGSTVLLP